MQEPRVFMKLPKPEVERCFFEHSFDPPLPAMELCWGADHGQFAWHLPEGVMLKGAAPTRFGITIRRCTSEEYQVRVLWNNLCLSWSSLTRTQIMASSLSILNALGTDLWYLLNQPITAEALAQAA